MTIRKILLGSALFFAGTLHAQQTPWSNQPTVKTKPTAEGGEKKLHLKLDTLVAEKLDEGFPRIPFYTEIKNWYSEPANKVGYGYVTEQGKPFGIWRYYTVKGNQYELFCEGYYETLTASNFILDEEKQKDLPGFDVYATGKDFIKDLSNDFYFTGEWRFYKNGKLDRILTQGNKVRLPLESGIVADENGNVTKTMISVVYPGKKRLSGTTLSTVYFSPEGLVTRVFAAGVDLIFGKDGKPTIPVLEESDIIVE